MNNLLADLLQRLNGKDYEKNGIKIIFAVSYFEVLDNGTAKLILKPCDNPDYDPQYWQKLEAALKEGAENDSHK